MVALAKLAETDVLQAFASAVGCQCSILVPPCGIWRVMPTGSSDERFPENGLRFSSRVATAIRHFVVFQTSSACGAKPDDHSNHGRDNCVLVTSTPDERQVPLGAAAGTNIAYQNGIRTSVNLRFQSRFKPQQLGRTYAQQEHTVLQTFAMTLQLLGNVCPSCIIIDVIRDEVASLFIAHRIRIPLYSFWLPSKYPRIILAWISMVRRHDAL